LLHRRWRARRATTIDDVHDRDFHDHGFRGGVFLYDPVYAYPYAQSGYWYFCPTANAYYPSIASCLAPWQLVPAR
jgi:hypothetical protein